MVVASNGSRKSSHTDMDDVSSIEADATLEKPAPVKMIPAPPPKENAWEKRKAQQQVTVVPANASSADTVKPPEAVESKEEIPKEDAEEAKVKEHSMISQLLFFLISVCLMSVVFLSFLTKQSLSLQYEEYSKD